MTKNAEILEILDNWSSAEIHARIAELEEARSLQLDWIRMTRDEKDAAWDKAS